jgi:hypothetical protein
MKSQIIAEKFNISKDGNLHLTLQPLSKNNKVVLFQLEDSVNLNQYGTPDEFWMSIDRKKLKCLATFINVYLENYK